MLRLIIDGLIDFIYIDIYNLSIVKLQVQEYIFLLPSTGVLVNSNFIVGSKEN